MTIIKCPKCAQEIKIDIKNSIDENGEVYECPYCRYIFIYTEK